MSGKKILHNGIVLPEEWPPQYPKQLFLERKVIPVPYLENPPEVITCFSVFFLIIASL